MKNCLAIFVIGLCCLCSSPPKNISSFWAVNDENSFPIEFLSDTTIIINQCINLKGRKMSIPNNVILSFSEKGSIINGVIEGYNTKIVWLGNCIFKNIRIQGSWNVPVVNTRMFQDIESIDAIKNIAALTSDSVANTVILEPGIYKLTVNAKNKNGLVFGDNTEIILNGDIELIPNDLKSYNIICLKGRNIHLHGRGCIIGDKFTHKGIEGEWGHGINVSGYGNVKVSDIVVKNCWGDCIYVRNKNVDISIDNCLLDNGRRQGISVTSARNVRITNCNIMNVAGKSPQYAVDIEPNKNDTIDYVYVENLNMINCKGGFLASGRAPNSEIKRIELRNSNCSKHIFYPFVFNTVSYVDIQNCSAGEGRWNIGFKNVKKFVEKSNSIVGHKKAYTVERK